MLLPTTSSAGSPPDSPVSGRPHHLLCGRSASRPQARAAPGAPRRSAADPSPRTRAAPVQRGRTRCAASNSENRDPSGVFSVVATKSPGNAGSVRRTAPRPRRAAASPQPSAPPCKRRYLGQQYPVTAQPAHRLVEQRHRSLGVRPRSPVQERMEPPRPLLVLVVREGVLDLLRALVRRRRALGVPLHARDAQNLLPAPRAPDPRANRTPGGRTWASAAAAGKPGARSNDVRGSSGPL